MIGVECFACTMSDIEKQKRFIIEFSAPVDMNIATREKEKEI